MSEDEEVGLKNESIHLDMDLFIKDNWIPVKEIGKGEFGKVYHVLNVKDGKEAAMKIERVMKVSVLRIEKEVMDLMKGNNAALQVYDAGYDANKCPFLIMTLCGFDLTKVSELLKNKFSDSTILRLAIRMLFAIKTLHEVGYTHRDLKPCNVAIDYKRNSHVVYLLDFGMARRFARKDDEGATWIIRAARSVCRFRGTLRYCSINMHKRIELGRVDDLWSWLYMVLELRVPLPWSNTVHPDKVEILKTELTENAMKSDPLTRGLIPMYEHFNTLTYPDRPDYEMIFNTLNSKVKEIGAQLSDPMDFDAIRLPPCPKVQEICKKYNVNLQEEEKSATEKTVTELLASGFGPNANDIPGGEKYIVKKGWNFYKKVDEKKKDSEPPSLVKNSSITSSIPKSRRSGSKEIGSKSKQLKVDPQPSPQSPSCPPPVSTKARSSSKKSKN